jgi:hypothetical protein
MNEKKTNRVQSCMLAALCLLLAVTCAGCVTSRVVSGEQLGDTGTDAAVQQLTEQQGTSAAAGKEIAADLGSLERILESGAGENAQFAEIVRRIQARSPVEYKPTGCTSVTAYSGQGSAEDQESETDNGHSD